MSHINTMDMLVSLLRQNPSSTDEQISCRLGVSRRTAARMVASLKRSGSVSVQRIRYKVGGNWVNYRIIKEITDERFVSQSQERS